MQAPTIHLNGTDGEELLAAWEAAADATRAAIQAWEAINPNARDFYPQGAGAWSAFQKEYQERCMALRRLSLDACDVVVSLSSQLDDRKR